MNGEDGNAGIFGCAYYFLIILQAFNIEAWAFPDLPGIVDQGNAQREHDQFKTYDKY